MAADFPYLYPYSGAEARRLGQMRMHEDSFRLNVDCARAIELRRAPIVSYGMYEAL